MLALSLSIWNLVFGGWTFCECGCEDREKMYYNVWLCFEITNQS